MAYNQSGQFDSPWNKGQKRESVAPTNEGVKVRSPWSTPGSATGDRKSLGVHRDVNAKR